MIAPGLANAVLVQHLVLGMFGAVLADFAGLLEKHLFLRRTLLLRLQGYQTCASAGIVAPGLANVVWVQHFMLGVFAHLFTHFGGLLEKHLFLRRTLLLRLQGYQTCAGAGMLAPRLANVVLVQHLVNGVAPGLANAVLVQDLVLIGMVDVGRLVGC